jgi:hypothetical protein
MHEFGHVLGFEHDDAGSIPVMHDGLGAGVSYLLSGRDGASAIHLGGAESAATASGLFGSAASVTNAGADWQVTGQDSSDPASVAAKVSLKLETFAKLIDAGRTARHDSSFDSLGRALLGKTKDR